MATFPFELASPARLVFSGSVDQVDVPGAEGDFGVLAGHAPLIATLRPGILTIREGGGAKRLYVRDGFAEVNAAGLTVLAEFAVPVEELDSGELQKEIEAAEARLAEAKEGRAKDKAAERVDQLKQIRAQLGAVSQSAH
ncbi:MAG TPA: F0F1 ATP synthase subunit epsilon [Xanthobacteraceae bacterium]|nr:F0F1 ATP synthase subunit epsilon [Xanthobacteraceae bacterium]